MEYEEYKVIYEKLNTVDDIEELKDRYDEEFLVTVYNQKVNRETRKRHHVVKGNAHKLLKEWKQGKSLMELSKEWKFSPLMLAMLIFFEDGASRTEFWEYINNPDLCSPAVAEELREIIRNDIVYSPEANERHRKRGIWGETLMYDWLDEQGIPYRTEKDLKSLGGKTPDCLLDEPMMIYGQKVYWIESKATFGDNTEFRGNSSKQLIPYTKLFGPGIVVYWLGRLNDLQCPPDVYVTDISILKEKLTKCEPEE